MRRVARLLFLVSAVAFVALSMVGAIAWGGHPWIYLITIDVLLATGIGWRWPLAGGILSVIALLPLLYSLLIFILESSMYDPFRFLGILFLWAVFVAGGVLHIISWQRERNSARKAA